MKINILLPAIIFILLFSCKKDDNTQPDNNLNNNQTEQKITIKGRFSTSKTISPEKVLIFNLNKQYYLSNVVNGQFAIDMSIGKIYGVLFLNSSNQMVGYLKLNNDFDFLPLTKVNDTLTIIDLDTLTAQGYEFVPTNNPLGTLLTYNNSEQQMLAMFDDAASSTIKHSDANQNGIIDLLENKLYYLQLLYFMDGGKFENNNLSPTFYNQVTVSGYRLVFIANDHQFPTSVTFTAPNNQLLGYNEGYREFDSTWIYWGPFIHDNNSTHTLPMFGIYTIGYNSQNIIVEIPDQSYIPTNVVTAIPTAELNPNGTLNKISWYYRTPNYPNVIDPKSLIKRILIQIEDYNHMRIYDSDNISPQESSHILTNQSIPWASVSYLMMTYEDIFGNQNIITFRK